MYHYRPDFLGSLELTRPPREGIAFTAIQSTHRELLNEITEEMEDGSWKR